MLTIAELADQYAWLYTKLPVPPGTWDHIIPTDGAYVAIKRVDGIDYVMFRGSTTFKDWMDDFEQFALPCSDPLLGDVHDGFRSGVLLVKDQLDGLVGDHVVVVGHSLGAGHALLYSGYRKVANKPVDLVVMWGAPRAGCEMLSRIVAPLEIVSFRNKDNDGHDLVTNVPFGLPPILEYEQSRNFVDVMASPDRSDRWGPFRYHHFFLYCKAHGAYGVAAASLAL
jgi:pimeloyl-ACP methyl ester carboxylesterase